MATLGDLDHVILGAMTNLRGKRQRDLLVMPVGDEAVCCRP